MRTKNWIASSLVVVVVGAVVVAAAVIILAAQPQGGDSKKPKATASAAAKECPDDAIGADSGQAPHLVQAERLIDKLTTGRPTKQNQYARDDQSAQLKWGCRGTKKYRVKAQCTSFVLGVLRHTYPEWATNSFFKQNFGNSEPVAHTVYSTLASRQVPHFERATSIHDLRPGSLLFIDYGSTAAAAVDDGGYGVPTGHAAIVRAIKGVYKGPAPVQADTPAPVAVPRGMVQYAVQVIDDTRSPHGTPTTPGYSAFPDTRIYGANFAKGKGAGYGYMILYANASGKISGYRWSATDPTPHLQDHPLLAVNVR